MMEIAVPKPRPSFADGVHYETEGVVANIIIIDNESEQNRLTPAAIEGLGRATGMLQVRDDLHVVVIRGAGRQYFSTGILIRRCVAR
jgi:enoyl-CoA hydratase/carnithine racemase